MSVDAKKFAFQNDTIDQMVANGWQLGHPASHYGERSLYTLDALAYVQTIQPKIWAKADPTPPIPICPPLVH